MAISAENLPMHCAVLVLATSKKTIFFEKSGEGDKDLPMGVSCCAPVLRGF
jgi:hypothetical protein